MFLGPSDWPLLHRAVWNHDTHEVERLLQTSLTTHIDEADELGWTALHLACAAENGMIFGNHQLGHRGYSRFSSNSQKQYKPYEWGPKRVRRGDDERVASMKILQILLEYGALVNVRAQGFCTPLHCAANSGWLSHAVALVQAGARVYTGPECSPLCWVKDGSGSMHPVATYLRFELGDRGLTSIEQDHARKNGTPYERVFPREEEPLLKTQTSTTINKYGLCSVCSEMSLELLVRKSGFKHLSIFRDVERSALCCKFCHLILSSLSKDCADISQLEGQVLIDASDRSFPPQPRYALTIRLSEGCRCDLNVPYPSPYFGRCQGVCADLMAVQVLLYTKQDMDGCFIPIQQGMDPRESPQHPETVNFMKECLAKCDLSHSGCQANGTSAITTSFNIPTVPLPTVPLPTRVIEVDNSDDMNIRIVDGLGKYARYAAFSHRWVEGPMPQWVTRHDSLAQRRSWFPVEGIGRSLVDAVSMTRSLGLRYIWIDSICIIQDSSEDWNNEAGKMASVYANAYVTLFADSAKDDDQGFLRPRKVTPSIPLTIRETDRDNSHVTMHIRRGPSGATTFDEDTIWSSHLSKRAWILQERILSRRRLHFGAHYIYWMCREDIRAEDGDTGMQDELTDVDRMMKSPQVNHCLFEQNWLVLVKLYSSMILTNKDDKLPALSGLASMFQKKSHHEYIAGIWKESLARGLAWYVGNTPPDKKACRPIKYRAPSFSWACVDDEITFRTLDHSNDVEFISSDAVLQGSDPFGKICSGLLVVSGLVQRAITLGPLQEDLGSLPRGHIPVYDLEMAPIGSMLNDVGDDIPYGEVMCLKLSGGSVEVFLVLVATDADDEDCAVFRRVGLGDTYVTGGSKYGHGEFFDGAQSRIVTIV